MTKKPGDARLFFHLRAGGKIEHRSREGSAGRPYTDLSGAKLRPVLMLRQSPRFHDWLVCMVSSRVEQTEAGFDEVLRPADPDFTTSGLKAPSVLRLSRLALLDGSLLVGSIGAIADERLARVRQRLAQWIVGTD